MDLANGEMGSGVNGRGSTSSKIYLQKKIGFFGIKLRPFSKL